VWCIRAGRGPGKPFFETFRDGAVEAFELYATAEAEVRTGQRPWAQLFSPRGNPVAECDAPPAMERAERMVELAFAG
jgi:hypothetical protein